MRITVRALLPTLVVFLLAAPLTAQRQDTTRLPPGVELATRYTKMGRPLIAVRPFSGVVTMDVAVLAGGVIRNDLELSDRFEMVNAPASLQTGPIDYAVWNSLNVVYLVSGELSEMGDGGHRLDITLHDVVYGTVMQQRAFPLPTTDAPDFRLAVHVVSDEIVRWIANQPGMAATRVAFVRQNGNGAYDLMMVDSDGENLRRLAGSPDIIYSPTWSPDGRKLMYMVKSDLETRLIERDMTTGRTRTVFGPDAVVLTPTYSPDNTRIIFGLDLGAGFELHEYDVTQACCLKRLTRTRSADNLSPTYSPDGDRVAFHSNRTGRQHIFVMDAAGGSATILSPFGERVEYAAPDWSPTSDEVVFHGASRGTFQLMLADASRPGSQIQQLTSVGRNEDPSWAPDGRHIVFTGVAAGAVGLYVIDTKTGQVRRLASGNLRLAEWSPSLAGTLGSSQ